MGNAPAPAPQILPPSGPQPGPNLIDIINALAEKADPLIKLLQSTMESYQKGQEREAKFTKHMAWTALTVILAIVGVAGLLTYRDKIEGSTFTFLLGLIVGYVLTFVRDQLTGRE